MNEKEDSEGKRLKKASSFIKNNPEGVTITELAKYCGVNRSTAMRWETKLFDLYDIKRDSVSKKYYINKMDYKMDFKFNIHEVQGICLAMRLLASKFWFPYKNAVTVLDKLSENTKTVSDILASQIANTARVIRNRKYPAFKDLGRIQNYLNVMTEAIANHKMIAFDYKKTDATDYQYYTTEPYALEPYPEGKGLYLICRGEDDKWRKFRVERMTKVYILENKSFIPNIDFIVEKTMINAWGIWDDPDKMPKTVRLKFDPAIAERVTSSNWHESEVTETLSDGSLLFVVSVAEPLEMLPWIRGWGANVEILEPADLRKRFMDEIKRMTVTYSAG